MIAPRVAPTGITVGVRVPGGLLKQKGYTQMERPTAKVIFRTAIAGEWHPVNVCVRVGDLGERTSVVEHVEDIQRQPHVNPVKFPEICDGGICRVSRRGPRGEESIHVQLRVTDND